MSLVFDSNNVSDGDNVVTGQFAESLICVYPQHFPPPFEAEIHIFILFLSFGCGLKQKLLENNFLSFDIQKPKLKRILYFGGDLILLTRQ